MGDSVSSQSREIILSRIRAATCRGGAHCLLRKAPGPRFPVPTAAPATNLRAPSLRYSSIVCMTTTRGCFESSSRM